MAGSAGTNAGTSNSNPYGPYADTIWNDLIAMGKTPAQAAGWLANATYEMGGKGPENNAVDSNGYRAYGIFSFNSEPGPFADAASIVTGNPTQDIGTQLQYLKAKGDFGADQGATTPAQAAMNIAHNFERCSECGLPGQSGGGFSGSSQTVARGAQADRIYAYMTGNPPPATDTSGVTGSQSAVLTSSTTTSSAVTASATGATAFFVELDKFFQGDLVTAGGGGVLGILTGSTAGIMKGVMTIVDRSIGILIGAGLCYMGFKLISQGGSGTASPGVVGTAVQTAGRGYLVGVRAEAKETYAQARGAERTQAADVRYSRSQASAREREASRSSQAERSADRRREAAREAQAARYATAERAADRRDRAAADRRAHEAIMQGERLEQRRQEEERRRVEASRKNRRVNTRGSRGAA